MDISVFVREPNATDYANAGTRKFSALPRVDEYISIDWEGEKKYFQVIAIHHASEDGSTELYAVRSEPPWQIRKSRAIGFGPSGK
jgi:hypothetical protein